MPVSRHTRNLDYRAYVEGLLGEETAMGLLLDLGEMAQAKFGGGGGVEAVAGDMIGEIVRARGELVNVGYDAYGVMFPGRYYLGHGAE